MAQRPTFIDLGLHPGGTTQSASSSSPNGLTSPRMMHHVGDVPPAMSPLDAFAAQSRLLAKELDNSRMNGRRVSRLPHFTVAQSLAKPRQGYFRSTSTEDAANTGENASTETSEEASGNRLEVEEPTFRPKSFYPRIGKVPRPGDGGSPFASPALDDQTFSTSLEHRQPVASTDYFGAIRAQSPESVASSRQSLEATSPTTRSKGSFDSHRKVEPQRGLSIESTSSRGHYPRSLLSPNPRSVRQTPSIRSIPLDSSDDENTAYTGSSASRDRKLSSSSAVSLPQSPLSPFMPAHARSPSVASEYSIGGSRLSRPTYNFSRPLSHSSRPSMEFPSRKLPSEIPTNHVSDHAVQTPMSVEKDEFFDSKEHQPTPAPSYIYAKYSLPRGRMLQRDSLVLQNTEMPLFEWDRPIVQTNVIVATPPADGNIDSSLPTPPHSIQSDDVPSSTPERTSTDIPEPVTTRPPPIPISDENPRYSMTSTNSGSTIKASASRTVAASSELTAEDHINKGIDCHERGSLKESTYHLRIAARQNHPTAMLLYALACRHGWGMRPNPGEGVGWLRKAMDSACLELGDDTSPANPANRGRTPKDYQDQKTQRAHFALSVYELGVSYMNGWGTEQDKPLALRCFETAAAWGDTDAMAEAGFCYTQGVGCKKDLRKAAKFYRMAEARGVSMIGNSWYVLLVSATFSCGF